MQRNSWSVVGCLLLLVGVSDAQAPVVAPPESLVIGKNDPRVPESESDQMVTALKKQGTPVWYVLAKDEGHSFQKSRIATTVPT